MPSVRCLGIAVLGFFAVFGSPGLAQEAKQEEQRPFLALDSGGHTASVSRVMFLPDGNEVLSVANDKTIRVWDVISGECLRVLRPPIGLGPEGKLYAGALSRDGKLLAVGGYGFNGGFCPIYVISMTTGEVVKMLDGHTNAIQGVAFSPDGKRLLSGSHDRTARIYEISTGQAEFILEGHTAEVYDVAFSPVGDRCATASYDHSAIIWNASNGQKIATLPGHTKEIRTISWSPNGQLVATASYDGTVRTFTASGKPVRTYSDFGEIIGLTTANFTADSKGLIYGLWTNGGEKSGILDLATGQRKNYADHDNTVMSADAARNGKVVATCDGSGRVCLWNPSTQETLRVLAGGGKRLYATGWSKDGNTIAWGDEWTGGDLLEATTGLNRTFSLQNLEFGDAPGEGQFQRAKLNSGVTRLQKNGNTAVDVFRGDEKISTLEMTHDYDKTHNTVNCMTILSGEKAVLGCSFGVYLYDMRSGQRLKEFVGHTGEVWAVSPSPDGRYFLTASDDMTIMIWQPDTDFPLLSLFAAGDEWIAWTPHGFYAASAGGERLMGWHLNTAIDRLATFHPAVQFRKALYSPQLIKLLLRAGSVDRALEVIGMNKTNIGDVLPPTVVVTSPDKTKLTIDAEEITVRAVAQQVGENPITSMQILLDGRPLGGKSGKKTIEEAGTEVRQTFVVPLTPGKHTIVVRADSPVSHGLSTPIEVECKGATVNVEHTTTLYVLAMGVSEYVDPDLKLNFAARDAQAIEETIRKHAGGVYSKVQTKVLVDKDATRAGMLGGLLWLKKQMTQHDIGVVFFSGHGDKDETGNFYLLPSDVIRDDLVVSAVSDAQIKGVLQGIPSRLMIIMDACHAGALDGDKRKSTKTLTDDLVRDLSNDDYGVVVMASSMGREFSLESSEHQNGYFTVALVEGLAGQESCDSNKDGIVYFNELDTYVSNRVKDLTGGKQHPVTAKPASIRPFPLTRKK